MTLEKIDLILSTKECIFSCTAIVLVLLLFLLVKNWKRIKSYYSIDGYKRGSRIFITICTAISVVCSYFSGYLYGSNILKIFYNIIGMFLHFRNDMFVRTGIPGLLNDISRMFSGLAAAGIITNGYFVLRNRKGDIRKIKKNNCSVIYTDSDIGRMLYFSLKKKNENVVLSQDHYMDYFSADRHIVAFNDDQNAISFLNKYQEKIKGKKLALILNDYEPSVFSEDGYVVYNLYEMIAKDFWLNNNPLLPFKNKKHNIAFVGLNNIGRAMLRQALLNNIFDIDQEIQYRVWGDEDIFETLNIDYIKNISKDSIKYEGNCITSDKSIRSLNTCDLIVVSDVDGFGFTEILTRVYGKSKKIYIYDKNSKENNGEIFKNFIDSPSINFFGNIKEILNGITNIYNDVKIEEAKKVNNYYVKKYSGVDTDDDTAWNNQDLYGRRQSIATASYNSIRKIIIQDNPNIDINSLAHMEHIRWTRFMFMDDWTYSSKLKIGEKNKSNKKHGSLVPYAKLTKIEKQKDIDIVRFLVLGGTH